MSAKVCNIDEEDVENCVCNCHKTLKVQKDSKQSSQVNNADDETTTVETVNNGRSWKSYVAIGMATGAAAVTIGPAVAAVTGTGLTLARYAAYTTTAYNVLGSRAASIVSNAAPLSVPGGGIASAVYNIGSTGAKVCSSATSAVVRTAVGAGASVGSALIRKTLTSKSSVDNQKDETKVICSRCGHVVI